MRKWKVNVAVFFLMVLVSSSWAVLTEHFWYDPDIGRYQDTYNNETIYCKAAPSTPDNSPLHESWNCVDEFIDGSPNPNFLTGPSANQPGYFYRMLFYGGTMQVDAGAKVGFYNNVYASDGTTGSGRTGTVHIYGHLITTWLTPWKGGTTMDFYMYDGGLLEAAKLNLGHTDGGASVGICHMYGGLIQVADMQIINAGSYMDMTGGELLILNSSKSIADVEAWITSGLLTNSSGEGLDVTTRDVGGALYTSVTLVPEPATLALLGIGSLVLIRRKKT